MDPFTLAILGGGALLDFFGGRSQRKQQERDADRQYAHENKWRERDDAWRAAKFAQSENDRATQLARIRVGREDFRPWMQAGVGAVNTLTSALGVRPAASMGGDPHMPGYVATAAPQRLSDLQRRAVSR